jgi:hypothetical protein
VVPKSFTSRSDTVLVAHRMWRQHHIGLIPSTTIRECTQLAAVAEPSSGTGSRSDTFSHDMFVVLVAIFHSQMLSQVRIVGVQGYARSHNAVLIVQSRQILDRRSGKYEPIDDIMLALVAVDNTPMTCNNGGLNGRDDRCWRVWKMGWEADQSPVNPL